MKWKDRLRDIIFTIKTGDGKIYTPQITRSVVELAFNTRDFMYLNQKGTYVARKEAKGEVFPIEFWFSGDDHVEQFTAFKESSKDKRAWIVSHPFYDEILVHPTQLRFESYFGQTVVTGTLKHTLPEKLPEKTKDLEQDVKNTNIQIEQNVINNVAAESVSASQDSIISIATDYNNLPNSNEDSVALKNLARDATNTAAQLLQKPVEFNYSLVALIKFPLAVANETKVNVKACENAILNLIKLAATDVNLFDIHSSAFFTSATDIAITGKYETRDDVVSTQKTIINIFVIQRDTFEAYDYEQDSNKAFDMYLNLSKTIERLNEIAFNAKQERKEKADKTASPIVFCHQYYGTSDESWEKFKMENKLTIDEHLLIRQGRELVYYV